MKYILVFAHDLLRFGITLADDLTYLRINRGGSLLAETSVMGQIPSDEYLIGIIPVGHQAHPGGHAVAGHHGFGDGRGLLDILGSAGGDIVENQFLGHTTA